MKIQMNAIKQLSLFAFLIILSGICLAQEPILNANASKTRVVVGEDLQISYSINGNASSFKGPSLNDFDVYAGPNQSSSVSIINGNFSQSISFSYIILAKKEGKFTIPPASVVANGKRIESKPITIEVVKGGASARSGQQTQSDGGSDYGNDIFIKCSVSKTKAYTGEQLIATYKIYTRLNIVDNSLTQMPILNGFWSEDITSKDRNVQLHTENYEGINYQVAELKKLLLFPQRSGTLELDPLALDVIVRQEVRGRSNNIWDIFGGGYRDARVTVKSRPVKVEILPVPEAGKPENYTGGVGNFSIEATISKEKVKTDEAVTLKFVVSGKGNLKLLEQTKPKFPADIEVYDPTVTDKIITSATGMSGSRTYEYLIIPRQAGEFKLSSFGFSYFDPSKKSYVSLESPEFILSVEKGTGTGSPNLISGSGKSDIKVLGSDIRYIKTNTTEFIPKGERFYGTSLFYILLFAPALLFAGFLAFYRKRKALLSDTIALKKKKASQVANRRLSTAELALKKSDYTVFYEEVYRALNGYFSDKLHLPVAGLSKEALASSLESRGGSKETIALLVKTLDECEFARYAPMKDHEGMTHVYNDAVSVIKATEQEIR